MALGRRVDAPDAARVKPSNNSNPRNDDVRIVMVQKEPENRNTKIEHLEL